MMLANRKSFDLMGVGIVEISTKSESLKNKIGSYDERLLEESEARLLKHFDDDKRANSIMSQTEKQMKKH